MGCNGGNTSWANRYLKNHPLAKESDYSYTSGHGVTGSCNTSAAAKGCVSVTGQASVTRNSPSQLKLAVRQQVVSVAIQADQMVFQQYTSGVITSAACGTSLDHAVAIVGYGTENGQEYFRVRNSWGASWGDHGYVKIAVSSGAGTWNQHAA